MLKEFITEKGIESIRNHKYVTGEYTTLDKKMNPFWNACVEYMPSYISPNMITFIGSFSYILSVIFLMKDGFHFDVERSGFSYFICGLAQLFYQTMDAIDGKQARRLGKSTPLGQLVDHGCDCIVASFLVYNILCCLKIGDNSLAIVFSMFILLFAFYYSNFAEYFTGILVTSNNNIGVTEVEFLLIALNWITAAFGSSFWHYPVFGKLTRL